MYTYWNKADEHCRIDEEENKNPELISVHVSIYDRKLPSLINNESCISCKQIEHTNYIAY